MRQQQQQLIYNNTQNKTFIRQRQCHNRYFRLFSVWQAIITADFNKTFGKFCWGNKQFFFSVFDYNLGSRSLYMVGHVNLFQILPLSTIFFSSTSLTFNTYWSQIISHKTFAFQEKTFRHHHHNNESNNKNNNNNTQIFLA